MNGGPVGSTRDLPDAQAEVAYTVGLYLESPDLQCHKAVVLTEITKHVLHSVLLIVSYIIVSDVFLLIRFCFYEV